jgi:L-seryl-tRNA(Ser) seleniumtransferase
MRGTPLAAVVRKAVPFERYRAFAMGKSDIGNLRFLPSVSDADEYLRGLALPTGKAVRAVVERVLQQFRERIRSENGDPGALPEGDALRQAALAAIAAAVREPSPRQLRRVINATGVVVHTNLGRAPLRASLWADAIPLLEGYTNLEYDLDSGQRGERGGRVPELLASLTEAEAGLVVNNNAAAVLLLLSTFAQGKEVIVSRGELVEIGGSFRVPDILRQSGARLVEVGTTNRSRLSDYAGAITPETVALLKVHRSNFALTGFVEEVSVRELAALARERGIAAWHDWGSGSLYRFRQPGLRGHSTAADEIRAGADVLTFSGDKLLGAVQAGIVVGRAPALRAMAKHPLYRSLRVDKVRLALLEQALLHYLDIGSLRAHNATVDLLERTVEEMEPLAQALLKELGAPPAGGLSWSLRREMSLTGGGAAPEARLDTLCLALAHPSTGAAALAAQLRHGQPPIVARVQEERVLLDFRALLAGDLADVARQVRRLAGV